MISRNEFWRGFLYGVFGLGAAFALANEALAANFPCSGKKGGIARCQGETFICNDGSISGSKKSCSASIRASGLLGRTSENMKQTSDGDCNCRDGAYCVGPRGGKFCLTDGGAKSYLRR